MKPFIVVAIISLLLLAACQKAAAPVQEAQEQPKLPTQEAQPEQGQQHSAEIDQIAEDEVNIGEMY